MNMNIRMIIGRKGVSVFLVCCLLEVRLIWEIVKGVVNFGFRLVLLIWVLSRFWLIFCNIVWICLLWNFSRFLDWFVRIWMEVVFLFCIVWLNGVFSLMLMLLFIVFMVEWLNFWKFIFNFLFWVRVFFIVVFCNLGFRRIFMVWLFSFFCWFCFILLIRVKRIG